MELNEIFTLYKNSTVNPVDDTFKISEKNIPKKVLALQITLGNLATLSNCCEFIKNDESVEKTSILNEYLSCLNFIFSIGLDMGIENFNFNPSDTNAPIYDQFLNLYVDINDFINFRTEDQFSTLLESFLTIGKSLGISNSDIYEIYNPQLKNNIS
ncbi:hypothetical protein CM240_2637 [Clostridium bornimense]|uniref:dUTPase n=1 Tax=Clostridium bornimense TaxID=1216932 RepID=W6RYN2_9CLOT|nr:dUTP diphosphatase [Clostridium bornimense]CDM69761.1 hypothetical protein CM240_2637 [Clostridium bornimense]